MLNNLTLKKDFRSFSVCPENPTGEKGNGGKALLGEGSASNAARELGQGWKVNPYVVLGAGNTAVLADVEGEGAIKHIWITDSAKDGRQLILKIYFDGREKPAVHVPLSDFFANADYRTYKQINSLAICFNPKKGMNCYFEMPYFKGFRIEIENIGVKDYMIYYQIDCEEKKIDKNSLYFHAQFRRVNPLPYMEPYTILDNIKGNGVYVGTYLHWGVKSNGWWGEGEIKFYMDGDKEYPTICGTGTEDYFCGSYDFEGVVVIENGRAMVTYLDIGESEGLPISMFPIEGRQIYPEKWRYDYWKTMHLGSEPPEYLWKEELYRDHFDTKKKLSVKEAREKLEKIGE